MAEHADSGRSHTGLGRPIPFGLPAPTESVHLRDNIVVCRFAASASSHQPRDSPGTLLSSNSMLMTNFLVLLLKAGQPSLLTLYRQVLEVLQVTFFT